MPLIKHIPELISVLSVVVALVTLANLRLLLWLMGWRLLLVALGVVAALVCTAVFLTWLYCGG